MELALAFLFIGGGALSVYSGLTGQPFVPALRGVLAGGKTTRTSATTAAPPGPQTRSQAGLLSGRVGLGAYPPGTTFDPSGVPVPVVAPEPFTRRRTTLPVAPQPRSQAGLLSGRTG